MTAVKNWFISPHTVNLDDLGSQIQLRPLNQFQTFESIWNKGRFKNHHLYLNSHILDLSTCQTTVRPYKKQQFSFPSTFPGQPSYNSFNVHS